MADDSGLKVPSWFQHIKVDRPTGKFNPGAAEELKAEKGKVLGFNPGQAEIKKGEKGKVKPLNKAAFKDEGRQPDTAPWGAYYFSLEVDKTEIAQFLECSGLKTTSEVFEIEEGGYLATTHKRPGRSKWENITLKRAVNKSEEFEQWRREYMNAPSKGWSKRKECTAAIVIRANDGTELRRFTIEQAWPVSWEGPSVNSGSSALAEETLEIAHDGIVLGTPTPQPQPQPQPLPDKLQTDPVNFKYDQPKNPEKDKGYTPEGQQAMDNTADQLNEHEEVKEVWVEGHTCDLGSYSYNLGLSKRRAKACRLDLEKKAPGKTYHDDGYSYSYPVQPNIDEAHRAQNRRVEFWQSARSGKRSGELDYKSYKK